MPNIQSVTEFRQQANSMIKEVNETEAPLFLTHNGKAAAVVVSPGLWKRTQDSLAMLQLLALREKDAEVNGTIDFEEAMSQIKAMIDAHGK